MRDLAEKIFETWVRDEYLYSDRFIQEVALLRQVSENEAQTYVFAYMSGSIH